MDAVETLRLRKLAAAEGNAKAQFLVGISYKEGKGVEKDDPEAFKWFQRAVQQNKEIGEAKLELGLCYYQGRGTNQDLGKAVYVFRLTAVSSDTDIRASAHCWLAECYRCEAGVEKNYGEAVRLFKLAAAQGYEEAQLRLDMCYTQEFRVPNGLEFAQAFQRATESNTAHAQFELGVCYYYGLGTKRRRAEACRLFRLAADGNHANAQYRLARCYQQGDSVGKNLKEAARLYKLAADQGHDRAQNYLGYYNGHGYGINLNHAEAQRLYRLAAEQNNSWH